MSGYFLTQSVFSIFNLRLGVLHYLLPQFIPDSPSSSLPQKNICGYYYLLGLDLAAALLCPIVTRYVLFFFFFSQENINTTKARSGFFTGNKGRASAAFGDGELMPYFMP